MKKLTAVFLTLCIMLSGAVCVNAEDLVFGGTLTIDYNDNSRVYTFADGEVNQNYRSQIRLTGGNTGYTFASQNYLPPGLSITEDGVVSGRATMRGSYSAISLIITAPDGTSKTFVFSLRIAPRPVYIRVTAPGDAVYDGVTHYSAEGKYIDYHTGEELADDQPVLRYGLDGLTDVVNAGEYRITYDTDYSYEVQRDDENSDILGDRYIIVHRASADELTINGVHDAEFDYDGHSHGLTGVSITSSLEPTKTIPFGIRYYNRRTGARIEGEPTAAGEYTAEVYSTDTNYEPKSETATITINAEKVEFTITNNTFTYNGEGQAPTVTATKTGEAFTEFTVSYLTSGGQPVAEADLKDGKPYKAGTYRVNITLNEPDKYLTDPITNGTFTIRRKEITLKIPQKTYFRGDENDVPQHQYPVVVPDPSDFTGYTVMYQYLDKDGNKVGEPTDYVADIGRYEVIWTLKDPDNYAFGTGNAQYVEVANKTIDFEFTDLTKTYKRDTAQHATVKATTEDGALFESHYTVHYTQHDEDVEPINAGIYYITIQPIHGHGVGTKNPDPAYLTINPQTVTFSVAEGETTSVDFDGQDHKVNAVFNAESDIIAEDYTVKFRNKATNAVTDAAHDAGEYDIIVDVVNPNYTAASEVIGTFTINSTYVWNMGNSPAAMIYKDTKMTDTQKNELLNQFKASRVFAEGNVPEGCNAGISYPLINGIDLDGDTNTVIVKDISNYTDPGITINNVEVKNGTPVAVEGVEGLYTVTYNGDNSLRRYVMEVGGKIGDTDASGYVNALDANALDKLNRAPANVTEARIWDVNKDGVLDRNDAAAIRRRFGVKLVPYYSWVK